MFEYTAETVKDIINAQKTASTANDMLLKYLRREQYTAATTGLTSRMINSWDSLGLLEDNRQEKGLGWRKFSPVDLIFITILSELRKFGMSVENLRNVKKYLFSPCIEADDPFVITWLEFAYLRTKGTTDDGNTYILIDSTGNSGVITERDLRLNRENEKLPDSYIYLNVNKILKDQKTTIWKEDSFFLHQSEKNLITTIRNTSEKEFKIKVNDDRKVTWIERSFSGDPKAMENLNSIISKVKYGHLNLTIKDGKPCFLHGTKQEKI